MHETSVHMALIYTIQLNEVKATGFAIGADLKTI